MMSTKPLESLSIKTFSTAYNTNPQTHQDLAELNAKLKNISDNIIPPSPYLLTVPTDVPYNISRHQANDWRRGTPFDANEEPLQYMSFLRDWDDGLITAVGGWDNDKGEIMDPAQQKQAARSSTSTPRVSAKKISLSDYKKKTAGQSTNGTSTANGHHLNAGQVNGSGSASKEAAAPIKASHGQKRNSSVVTKAEPLAKSQTIETQPPPPKKQRLTSPPSQASGKRPETKPSTKLKLPPPISPTLPPAIEHALKKNIPTLKLSAVEKPKVTAVKSDGQLHGKSQATDSQNSKAQSKSLNADKSASEATRASKSSSSIKKLPEDLSQKPNGSLAEQKKPSIATAAITKSSGNVNTEASTNGAAEKRRLIVKLKIPRPRRTDLARLLRMKPRPSEALKAPKSEIEPIVKSVERDSKSSKTEKDRPQGREGIKSLSQTIKPRDKRDRDEDLDVAPQSKRHKHPAALDLPSKPSTPLPPAFKSPVLSHHGSAQKGKTSTPTPDTAAKTPQGSGRNGTPATSNSVEKPTRDGRSSSNTSSVTSMRSKEDSIKNERSKLWDVGRALKRQSAALQHQAKEQQDSSQKEKLSIAYGIETILCFMIAYILGDELAKVHRQVPDASTSWGTIHAFLGNVKEWAKSHTFMHGLCAQLEAICHIAYYNSDMERYKPESFVHTRDTHFALIRRYKTAQTLFIEGSSELSVEDLQQCFPKSWQLKSRAPLAQSPPKIIPGSLGGDFYLPITTITTTIESVRAARSLLGEWCKSEGVDWRPSLSSNLVLERRAQPQ